MANADGCNPDIGRRKSAVIHDADFERGVVGCNPRAERSP
jgi:hypothetical protein